MNPKYSIYIPSKGRWDSRLTMKALDRMGVSYRVVIEPQEYDNYVSVIDRDKIITLPYSFPDSFTELVRTRNWIFQYSIDHGEEYHWQIDDNIIKFWYWNKNRKTKCFSGSIFRAAEDFIDRYDNVGQAGFNYFMFVQQKYPDNPFRLNTRIYSCTLNNNKIPYRYRGIYNDDTDISLRILKGGWCTVLFQAFLAEKSMTMTVKGGNTPIYQEDGRLKMAQSLQRQHPDVVSIKRRWGRWQHVVDYRPFKGNKLKLKEGVVIPQGVNNYGMKLVKVKHDQT